MIRNTRWAALALLASLSAPTTARPLPYAAALAAPTRPAADKTRDAARKPAELLAFARIEPGQTVVDFIMGGGYLTHVLAGAVGPRGRVFAYQPAEFVQYRAAYGTEQDAAVAPYRNVTASRVSLGAIAFPTPVDTIVTVQNYHDLHLKAMPAGMAARVDAALFKALKPGGTLVVVDHVANPGDTVANADTLHRIDPAVLRQEIEAAGFRFDGESQAWRNPSDDHAKLVFDPAVRGKTDQIAYRFVKPR